MKKIVLSTVVASAVLVSSAFAHFQLNFTPNSALEKGETVKIVQTFTHPFADEHTMDMAGIEEFYVINKGKKKCLKETLKPITFQGNANSGKGFATSYKAQRMGDHVMILVPKPYFEKKEDIYMQQITKTMINVAGVPTDWDTDFGLKAEIVPLTKPYAIWEGGSFTGIVKSNGEPVPFAGVEVGYLNRDVDVVNYKMGPDRFKAPQDSFVTMGIKADKNGVFTFALPTAGFWGFAALGVGSDTEHKGKELSQDAVIWVEAKKMERN